MINLQLLLDRNKSYSLKINYLLTPSKQTLLEGGSPGGPTFMMDLLLLAGFLLILSGFSVIITFLEISCPEHSHP